MRRAARTDANQAEVVKALRDAGATVTDTSGVGSGFPDLCVGYKNATYCLEVKDGSKPPSAQKLSQHQEKWHREWKGHACVVNSPEAALAAIGVIPVTGEIS
jgi:Holliday junction resolvase